MIVFVTGGIGAGKSTAIRILSELGAETARADDIVHELLTQAEVQREVARALGVPDASDRAAIAEIVFRDDRKRRVLESILHPLVAEAVRQRVAGMTDPLVYEIPLLPTPRSGDVVIAIDAPESVRVQRLIERGMSEDDARLRIEAQPTADAYRELADVVVSNAGDEGALRSALTEIWEGVQRDQGNL